MDHEQSVSQKVGEVVRNSVADQEPGWQNAISRGVADRLAPIVPPLDEHQEEPQPVAEPEPVVEHDPYTPEERRQMEAAERRVEQEKKLRAERIQTINALNEKNKESLRSGHSRLGWHIGEGEHEMFLLDQPVDVLSQETNRDMTWNVTNRYYVFMTREGIRALRINKGELNEAGTKSMTTAPATRKATEIENNLDPFSEDDLNGVLLNLDENGDVRGFDENEEVPDLDENGEQRFTKVEDFTTSDNRTDGGEMYLRDCLEKGREACEDGKGELELHMEDFDPNEEVKGQFGRALTEDEKRERYMFFKRKPYHEAFKGFTKDGDVEMIDMRWRFGHYNADNRTPDGPYTITAEIPESIVLEAVEKSKKAAEKPREIPPTPAEREMSTLGKMTALLS